MAASFDRLSGGRLLINLVTGGDRAELEGDGVFLDHAQRYEQSAEFIRIWREILSAAMRAARSTTKVNTSRSRAPSCCSRRCKAVSARVLRRFVRAAHDLAAEQVDAYLTWGEPPAEVAKKIADVRERRRAMAAA